MKTNVKNVTRADIHLAIDHAILGHRTVTVFANPLGNTKRRVRITRITYGKNKNNPAPISNGVRADLIISIGRPNYEEREFLRLYKKAKTKPRKIWFPRG